MNNLIVGINYQQNGQRVIEKMYYDSHINAEVQAIIANDMADVCDEVYIVDTFDPASQDFINEIVTKSCRIYKTTT